jgi:hypothetical protein
VSWASPAGAAIATSTARVADTRARSSAVTAGAGARASRSRASSSARRATAQRLRWNAKRAPVIAGCDAQDDTPWGIARSQKEKRLSL